MRFFVTSRRPLGISNMAACVTLSWGGREEAVASEVNGKTSVAIGRPMADLFGW